MAMVVQHPKTGKMIPVPEWFNKKKPDMPRFEKWLQELANEPVVEEAPVKVPISSREQRALDREKHVAAPPKIKEETKILSARELRQMARDQVTVKKEDK